MSGKIILHFACALKLHKNSQLNPKLLTVCSFCFWYFLFAIVKMSLHVELKWNLKTLTSELEQSTERFGQGSVCQHRMWIFFLRKGNWQVTCTDVFYSGKPDKSLRQWKWKWKRQNEVLLAHDFCYFGDSLHYIQQLCQAATLSTLFLRSFKKFSSLSSNKLQRKSAQYNALFVLMLRLLDRQTSALCTALIISIPVRCVFVQSPLV